MSRALRARMLVYIYIYGQECSANNPVANTTVSTSSTSVCNKLLMHAKLSNIDPCNCIHDVQCDMCSLCKPLAAVATEGRLFCGCEYIRMYLVDLHSCVFRPIIRGEIRTGCPYSRLACCSPHPAQCGVRTEQALTPERERGRERERERERDFLRKQCPPGVPGAVRCLINSLSLSSSLSLRIPALSDSEDVLGL